MHNEKPTPQKMAMLIVWIVILLFAVVTVYDFVKSGIPQ